MANELVTDDAVDDEGFGDDVITDAMLRESAALSVIGRAANSVGNPADIVAASNLQYFGRRSDALGFFALTEDDIGAVISRQTLGGDAQELVFAVSDTDERIEIEGFGEMAGSASITVRFNDNATAALHSAILQVSGGSVTVSSAIIAGAWVGPGGFHMIVDLKDLNLKRGGFSTWWSANTANTSRSIDRGGFVWPNAADPVTSFTIRGSDAATFKSGFRTICRRRKML